jgi:hypothetical protein
MSFEKCKIGIKYVFEYPCVRILHFTIVIFRAKFVNIKMNFYQGYYSVNQLAKPPEVYDFQCPSFYKLQLEL